MGAIVCRLLKCPRNISRVFAGNLLYSINAADKSAKAASPPISACNLFKDAFSGILWLIESSVNSIYSLRQFIYFKRIFRFTANTFIRLKS